MCEASTLFLEELPLKKHERNIEFLLHTSAFDFNETKTVI